MMKSKFRHMPECVAGSMLMRIYMECRLLGGTDPRCVRSGGSKNKKGVYRNDAYY